MYFDKNIIDETITYILNEDYDDEDKKKAVEILSNQPIDINDNSIYFWSCTPLFKEISKNKDYVYMLFDIGQKIGFSILQNCLKFVDPKIFFNQDFVIKFCKEDGHVSYFSRIDGFFDYYEGELQKELVDEYVSGLSFKSLNFLNILPEKLFNYVIDNLEKEKKDALIKTFIHSNYFSLNEYVEKNIFDISKNSFDGLSLSEKLQFINRLSNISVKKEAFYYLKLDKNLDLVISKLKKEISLYVDEEILLQKLIDNIDNDIYIFYLEALSPEYQIKALKALSDKRIRISAIEFYLKPETLKILFEEYNFAFSNSRLYDLYKEYKNIEFLKAIKNNYLKSDFISIEILCEDDFVNLLNDEEKQIIKNKIANMTSFSIPSMQVKFNDYFFKIYKEIMIDYYNKNPEKKVFITMNDLMKKFNLEEQLVLIKHFEIKSIISDAISNDNNIKFLLELLEHNPNIINEGIKDDTNVNDIFIRDSFVDNLLKIIDYIDSDNLKTVISKETVKNSYKISKIFYDNINTNPNLVSNIDMFELLDENQLNNVLENIKIKSLEKFILEVSNYSEYKKYSDIVFKYFYKRFDEYLEFKNEDSILSFMEDNEAFDCFDDEHKKLYVSNLKTVENLSAIIKKDCEYSEFAIDRLLNIYEKKIRYNYISSYVHHTKVNLDSYNDMSVQQIISKMNILQAIYCYIEYPDIIIEQQIIRELKENPNGLLDEVVAGYINNVYYSFSEETKNLIQNILDSNLNSIKLYTDDLSKYIQGMDVSDKIRFLDYYNKGYINDNYELIVNLLKNNPFLFKTTDSIIFNDDIKGMNFRFIDKISKYSNMEKTIRLISADENKFKFFVKVAKNLDNKNYSDVVYDKMIYNIIHYITSSRSNKVDYSKVDENNIEDFIQFILYDSTNIQVIFVNSLQKELFKIEEMYDFEAENFINNKRAKCDELFENTLNVDEMKNMYFNKYFGMSVNDVERFYKKYIFNYDKVMKYAESDLPLLFINIITKVLNINDPITLKELYMTSDIYYDISDIYEIESIMSKAYFKSLVNDYKDKQNGQSVRKIIKDKDGNDVELEMTELLDNFGILVHSTCAYGEMPLIDDNYYKSWNYNPNTENHGICCSYITNSSYGTADVSGNGVMLGFTTLTSSSVAEYSPYDLCTSNAGFNITCCNEPFYTLLDDIDDYTRHTHNEFDLERRIPNDKHFCVQPDCIIIFEDMNDKIKANSIKAYQDFKAAGIDIKLIYMDRVKIAHNESNKLKNMIMEYNNSKDLNLLRDIINKYESNICGCDYLAFGNEKSKQLFDKDELFMTDIISNLLFTTLDEINELRNVDKFLYYLSILENEQYKFNLLDDKNSDRKHTFKLYSDELKNKIEIVKQNLNVYQNENTK